MDIIKSIEHRMNLLEQTNNELEEKDFKSEDGTLELDQKITYELRALKEQTKAMLDECNSIHKAIFELGIQLREKVTKQELERFDKQLQEWHVDQYITIKELNPTFKKYANQQL